MKATAALWRSVVVPVEHGGWGFLGEPILLGLCLAPTASGVALAAAVVAAFLARQPLRLALLDRRRGTRHARTLVAQRAALSFSVLAMALVLLALVLSGPAFWPAVALGLLPGALAVVSDARGTSREAVPEVAGAVALATSAPAIALAGGVSSAVALGAWALLALRAWTSILYVRARLRLDRGRPAGVRTVLVVHVFAVLGAVALVALGHAPRLAVVAFVLFLARAAHGLSSWRPPLRPQALGFRELGFGLAAIVLLVAGYRAAL